VYKVYRTDTEGMPQSHQVPRLVVHDAQARSGGALLVRAFDGVRRRGDLTDLRSDGGLTLPWRLLAGPFLGGRLVQY